MVTEKKTKYWKKVRWVFIILSGSLIFWYLVSLHDELPTNKPKDIIRLASVNADCLNDDIPALVSALEHLQADVLVLLEWQGKNPPLNKLKGMRPIISALRGYQGIVVLVNNNLDAQVKAEVFYSRIKANTSCRIPMAAIRLSQDEFSFSIVGIHIPPPHIRGCRQFTEPTLNEIADFIEDGRLKVPVKSAQRNDPVVVMGDFNVHPLNSAVRKFKALGMIDAIGQKPIKFNPTWPARFPVISQLHGLPFLPLFRIDFIMVSKYLKIIQAWCVPIPGSDHRGVVSDIKLN